MDLVVHWNKEHGVTHYCMDPWPEEPLVAWPIGQLVDEQYRGRPSGEGNG